MAEGNQVKLHGMWDNKSSLLLQYNPVHKKIPVLVHNGKPIVESYIILEYIDETWQNSPRLLPKDTYERAQVRFWASFIQQQLLGAMSKMITSKGEEQEKAIEEVFDKMNVLEKGTKDFLPEGISSVDCQNLGVLDILVCATFSPHKANEEVFGVEILDPEKYPLVFSWVQKLNELPVVQELLPTHDKLVAVLQFIK